jgi:hypothetical protein
MIQVVALRTSPLTVFFFVFDSEIMYEDTEFKDRALAALVASKVPWL